MSETLEQQAVEAGIDLGYHDINGTYLRPNLKFWNRSLLFWTKANRIQTAFI